MHEDQSEQAGYSISATPPEQPERRADERFVRLLRVGAILVADRRELCLIRNISAGGMMIRAYSPIAVGTAVVVELKQGDPVKGTVHWVQDDLTGVRFDQLIDVVGLLATNGVSPQPRLPRIELKCDATVRQQARLVRVTVLNVSQGGLCVRSSTPLELGGEVITTLPGLPPAAGTVRWNKGESFGIGFNRPLVLSSLVAWLQEQQSRAGERLAG